VLVKDSLLSLEWLLSGLRLMLRTDFDMALSLSSDEIEFYRRLSRLLSRIDTLRLDIALEKRRLRRLKRRLLKLELLGSSIRTDFGPSGELSVVPKSPR
jgi:hypothetical protein